MHTKKNIQNQSIIEYLLVAILVAVVIAVALLTLGEDKEDYLPEAENTEEVEK